MSRPASNLFPVNFLTGMSDGLFLPFAAGIVASAMSGGRSALSLAVPALFSLGGALVYGLARYFGEREEILHHHPGLPGNELDKEQAMMQAVGIDPGLADDIRPQLEAERSLWLKEVQEHGMGWERPDKRRALRGGLHTALGFLTGGLCAGFYAYMPGGAFLPAVAMFVATAGMMGYARGLVTGKSAWKLMLTHMAKAVAVCCCAWIIALIISLARHQATPLYGGLQLPNP